MSFRKRNVILSQKGDAPATPPKQIIPGTRPSPVTGHSTTSTGTESLDKLLALGAGLALGSCLMIEEEGTTEFARSLLSYYAAEGVIQGHAVFVVGPEGSLSLPGIAEEGKKSTEKTSVESEKMKIAWRYERLGAFEERDRGYQRSSTPVQAPGQSGSQAEPAVPFCHTFDLTKRLTIPSTGTLPKYLSPSSAPKDDDFPYTPILAALRAHLEARPLIPTRLVIPSLLSPLIYQPQAGLPHHLVPFLHQLRALLRSYNTLTVMMTWPLALYPVTHPLTRWSRQIVDGVITLRPFPHSFSVDAMDLDAGSGTSSAKGKSEDKMQGLIKVGKLPILTEKGISVGIGEDMAFAVGRKSFKIRPFHLPPLEDDGGGGGGEQAQTSTGTDAKNLEF